METTRWQRRRSPTRGPCHGGGPVEVRMGTGVDLDARPVPLTSSTRGDEGDLFFDAAIPGVNGEGPFLSIRKVGWKRIAQWDGAATPTPQDCVKVVYDKFQESIPVWPGETICAVIDNDETVQARVTEV